MERVEIKNINIEKYSEEHRTLESTVKNTKWISFTTNVSNVEFFHKKIRHRKYSASGAHTTVGITHG